MTQEQIVSALRTRTKFLLDFVDTLSENEFNGAPEGKWTTGQQLQHLIMSTRPLRQAFLLPSWLGKMVFGKSNRPGKTYEALVEKYKGKLAAGGRATARFRPPLQGFSEKERLKKQLQKEVNRLCALTMKKSPSSLDQCILPHPLLGKLTLREMLYFTIYHTEHHHHLIKQYSSATAPIGSLQNHPNL